MIKRKRLLILLLLVTSVLLIPWAMSALMFDATAVTAYGSPNQATQPNSLQVNFGNVHLTENKITAEELGTLESEIGIYQQGKNYNEIVDGHGTGLRPPTADEWDAISQNAYVIDSVGYPNTPSSVDNSNSSYFPPIGNQGSQNSCVAWSIGYYVATFEEAKAHGWNLTGASWSGGQPTTTYQNKIISPAFIYNLINNGTNEYTYVSDAINLVCSIGASSWANMPYNPNDSTSWPSQAAWTEAPNYRGNSSGIQYTYAVDQTGLSNLKNLLASGNLVSISVDGSLGPAENDLNLTNNDVSTLDNYQGNPLTINHEVTIVGYDDNYSYVESGKIMYGAFKVANSWGLSGWEPVPTGFYWISYATMEQRIQWCYSFFDQSNYQPDLLATFNINDNARGNCIITVGLGTPNNPIITKCFTTHISGGNQSFCTNNIVMDISEFGGYVHSFYNQQFFLQVYDTGSYSSASGTITYFAIGNCISSGTPFQTVKGQNVFLNVTYNPQYQLTMSTNYGTVSPASGIFYVGNTFNITATSPAAGPGERYVFLGWTGTGVGSYSGLNNPASITINSNITETASWINQYYLTVSSAYGNPGGAGWYNSGTSAYASTPLVVAGVTGTQYVFTGWSGGASGTSSTSNPITMNGPKTATANWQTQYNLTFVQSGTGLDFSGPFITVNGTAYNRVGFSTWANPGTVYNFSYSPLLTVTVNGEEYVLTGISGNSTSSSLTVSSPTTVVGAYQAQYYLTATSTYGSAFPSSGWFNSGSSITEFVASPIAGVTGTQYACSGWTGTGSIPTSGGLSAVTFTINTPSTITWNWATQYYLTVNSAYGTPAGQGWYNSGASASFNVPSPVGSAGVQYVFSSWSGSGSGSYNGSSASSSVTMNVPITETASWITQYYLTVNSAYGVPSGSGWYNSGSSAYAALSSGTIPAGTGSQYVFVSWSTGGTSYAQSNVIIMNSPVTTTASWQTQYQIVPSADSNTLINPSNAVWENAGSSQIFIYSSSSGYNVNSVIVDGSSVQITGSYTFSNVQASHTISVISAVNPNIISSAGAGGSISPSGSVNVNYGGSQSFSITANAGYYIFDVVVNGSSVGAVSSYTFTNIQGTYIISATFAPNPTPTPSTTPTATPTPSQTSTPAPTPTPNPTPTPSPSPTAIPTPTPIPTPIPIATVMPTPTPTTSPNTTPNNKSLPPQSPTTVPNHTQSSLPQGAIYGIVVVAAVVVIIAATLLLRKLKLH